ncbi:MAG: hypothetical protein ACR2NF_03710 [Pirellulales bacterium]
MSIKTKANALITTSILATLFALASTPLIPERCDSCGQREDALGLAAPLRLLSPLEWLYDTTIDLHCNGQCPTIYALKHGAKK